MTTFRFRLDPVLGHRERAEREAAGAHAKMLADQLVAERMRDELVNRRDQMRDELIARHARFDGDHLRATYAHLGYLDRAIRAAQERVDACVAETARAHRKLVETARDRKVLETLKARRRETFDLERAQAEQRELDDLNARLFERASLFEGPSL
jgi:flagellar export protein FliJ